MFRGTIGLTVILFIMTGCATINKGNKGQVQNFAYNVDEPPWLRDGQPIEFESALWYPSDNIESLLDSEMLLVGQYRGVQFFVERTDVRPYARIYTKFARNKFRYFKQRKEK